MSSPATHIEVPLRQARKGSALAALACCLAIVGCGGDSSPTPTSPAPVAAPTPAPTTFSLTGTVMSSSGTRLSGATVAITGGPNNGRTTTTGTTGDYRFDSMQVGSTTLVARATGHQDQTTTINFTATGVLNFTMQPVQAATPTFTGSWRGRILSFSCQSDGQLANFCSQSPTLSDTLVMTLVQTGSTVTGNVNVGGFDANATGTVQGGRMSLSASTNRPNGISVSYESWDSSLSGANSMSGDFVVRFYPTSSSSGSGSARYRVNMVGVVRQ